MYTSISHRPKWPCHGLELAQNNRPGIDENRLNIEQNEQHGDQVELHREALPGVAHRGHAAFVRRQFGAGGFTLPNQPGKRDNRSRNAARHKNMDQKREVASEVIVGHRMSYI